MPVSLNWELYWFLLLPVSSKLLQRTYEECKGNDAICFFLLWDQFGAAKIIKTIRTFSSWPKLHSLCFVDYITISAFVASSTYHRMTAKILNHVPCPVKLCWILTAQNDVNYVTCKSCDRHHLKSSKWRERSWVWLFDDNDWHLKW